MNYRRIPKEPKTRVIFACIKSDKLFEQCSSIAKNSKDKMRGFFIMDYANNEEPLQGIIFVIFAMRNTKNIQANKEELVEQMKKIKGVLIKDEDRDIKRVAELIRSV